MKSKKAIKKEVNKIISKIIKDKKNADFDDIVNRVVNESPCFIYMFSLELIVKNRNNVFKLNENQFKKIIEKFFFTNKDSKSFFKILYESSDSSYNMDLLYNNLLDSQEYIEDIFIFTSHIKSKEKREKIQNLFIKFFLIKNNNSILNIDISNKMKKHFDSKVLKDLVVTINQNDFELFHFEQEIPKINCNEDFLLPIFIVDNMNCGFKEFVLDRQLHMADLSKSYNEKSQEINIINKNIKDMTIAIYSSILYLNCKNKNTDSFKNLIKINNDSLYSRSFLEYYENINLFLKENNYFMAVKEAILFFEFNLRVFSKERTDVYKEIINIIKKEQREKDLDILRIIEQKRNKKFADYEMTLYNDKIDKKFENFEINIDKVSFETLLDAMVNTGKISDPESEIIKYILLNNKNEGLNFRNKIFHSLISELNIKKELGDWTNHLLFFIVLYLVVSTLKMNSLKNGEEFNYVIRKKNDIWEIL